MKEQIEMEDIRKFKRDSMFYTMMLAGTVLLPLPLLKYLKELGIWIWIVWYGITIWWALRIEKQQKVHDIHTYKEIMAFLDGKRLDELEKQREIGKRPYQKFLIVVALTMCSLVAVLLLRWLLFYK